MLNGSKKAKCVLGLIKRNIKCKNAATIMRLYKSLVRPRPEYCIQAGFLYHTMDIEVSDGVQKRATKMVYGYWDLNYKDRLSLLELSSLEEDLNYKDRLSLLELSSLEERRVRGDLIETIKLLKDIAKLHYNIFFKLPVDSKFRGHTYTK